MTNKEIKELFFSDLSKRISCDSGAEAVLKRSAGKSMSESSIEALTVYASVVPNSVQKDVDFLWFSVACMFAVCDGKNVKERTFAQALGVLNERTSTNGLDAKMLQLLKTPMTEESLVISQIYKLVQRLVTKGIYFNVTKLLEDMISLYYENVDVKLEWVKQYKSVN